MGGFSNYLVTKTGNLVRTFIQSPNFVHLVSGWQIAKDGSAEFNNVTIRGGEVIGGTTLGYDGTPALGNLIYSESASDGTDGFGNEYFQGVCTYLPSGGAVPELVTQMFNGALLAGSAAGITNTGGHTAGAVSGDSADGLMLLDSGGQTNSDPAGQLAVLSAAAAGRAGALVQAFGAFVATSGTAANPTAITTDTWHSLGSAGSTGCTLEQARYTMTPELETEIDIALVVGSGGSTPGTYTWANTLPTTPVNYVPAGNFLRIYALTYNAAIASGSQAPIIAVDGAGTANPGRVRITIPALAAGVVLTGSPRIPLT